MNTDFFPSRSLEAAVNELSKLPGIGKKTALRLALHILKHEDGYAHSLGNSILLLKEHTKLCNVCHSACDSDVCVICSNPHRERSIICVVESIREIMAIERTNQYIGVYHVLGGIISPMNGVGPKDLFIDSLVQRVAEGSITEIIFALSTTMEGDTTNFYLYKRLKDFSIKITSIARGVAIGDELEYTDEVTLGRSLLNRIDFTLNV
jgi:recombination protein RecR